VIDISGGESMQDFPSRHAAVLLGLLLIAALTSARADWLYDPTKFPPTKAFIQTGPNYDTRIRDPGAIGIVTDACLARVQVGKDFLAVDASHEGSGYMLDATASLLAGKGYDISYRAVPFVCGAEPGDAAQGLPVMAGDQTVTGNSPYFTDASIQGDPELGQALLDVERLLLTSVGQHHIAPATLFAEDASIPEKLRLIAQKTGLQTLLVAVGRGARVSGSKSFSQAMTTGMFTGLATGGVAIYTQMNVSTLDSYVGLIDLASGELIWANSLRHTSLDPTEQDTYAVRWSHDLLYFIPDAGADPTLTDYGFGYAGNLNRDAAGLESLTRLQTRYAEPRRRISVTFGKPRAGKGEMLKCFLLAVITSPRGTFASYLQETIKAEMDLVGIYSDAADASVGLTLRVLDVDRKRGNWEFGVDLDLPGEKTQRVEFEYPFELGEKAAYSCENAQHVFGSAALAFADAIIGQPAVEQLVMSQP
jgi:hypothetical protein